MICKNFVLVASATAFPSSPANKSVAPGAADLANSSETTSSATALWAANCAWAKDIAEIGFGASSEVAVRQRRRAGDRNACVQWHPGKVGKHAIKRTDRRQ